MSITTGILLDKILTVPVITLVLTAELIGLGQCQTEKNKQMLIKLAIRPITIHFKTKKHEAFHSLTVAVFRKSALLEMSYADGRNFCGWIKGWSQNPSVHTKEARVQIRLSIANCTYNIVG